MSKKDNKHEITVKIEGESWKNALDKAFNEEVKKVNVDGFRKGKVPREIFEKKFGKERLYIPAVDNVIEEGYVKALEESKLIPVVQPKLDIKSIDDKHIEYVFTLTLKPEVKLGEYKNLPVKKETVKVSKKEIEEAIDNMREEYKENIVKNGKIEKNDIAVIDFEGFKDGVAFEGGKGENYSLTIGSNTFIPGFEEQLIGLSAGDKKDIELSFPDDYHVEDLKGQPVVFKVNINEVKQVKLPELDKDFFDDLGMEGIDSKESLEKQVKENIKARKESEAEEKYTDLLLSTISEKTEIDVPETMINEEVDHMIEHFKQHISMQGITIEQFYQLTNSNEEKLKEQYKDEALKRIRYRLILEEIIKKEKIEVSDEEVEAKIDELAKKYNMTKDEVKKEYNNNLEYIAYDLKVKRAFEIIKGE